MLFRSGCVNEPTKPSDKPPPVYTNNTSMNVVVENNTNQTLTSYGKCHQNNFTIAFILVANSNSEVTPEKIQRVNEIKNAFPSIFYNATLGLANMDTSYPVVTIIYPTTEDVAVVQKISKKFYESNPDNFDFINIFPANSNFSSVPTSYTQAQSFTKGIGLPRYYDHSEEFGSNRKLLGSAYYKYSLEYMDLTEASANTIINEIGHQWCCYAGSSLGILDQLGIHFDRAFDSKYENGAHFGSYHWIPNGDGTYRTNRKEVTVNRHHPFYLYFMGLYTENNFDFNTKFKLYNVTFDDRVTFNREISIKDIIAVEGKRECLDVLQNNEPSVGPTINNN